MIHTYEVESTKQFIITKKVAKHGSQAVIVVPKMLQGHIKPRSMVRLTIDVLEEADDDVA